MSRFENIFFDLDGTLTDSEEGIVYSLEYALAFVGIKDRPWAELSSFIGPPLDESMRRLYQMKDEDIRTVSARFRERYHERGMCQENKLYPGVRELLDSLVKAGKSLFIVSTKDEGDVRAILSYFDFTRYFKAVMGGSFEKEQRGEGSSMAKSEMVRQILEQLRLDGAGAGAEEIASRSVMVGDRDLDIEAGRLNGIIAVGTLYGYGSKEELEQAGADYLFPDVAQLQEFLLS